MGQHVLSFCIEPTALFNEKPITKTVQNYIDECYRNGGGEIRFLKGKHVLSTLFLRSNVTIILDEGAELLGSLNFYDYCPDEKVDYDLWQDASHSFFHCSMFVGIDCENISIVGKGTIDMRSVWDDDNSRKMFYRGAKTIALKNCKNVKLHNIGIYNTTDLAVYFAGCENVEVDGIKMRVYIDGISPDNSNNVIIKNCYVESGDDGIVFKTSYSLNRREVCKNIHVENCKIKSRCNAIKFGTETIGGFENITIKNIEIVDTRITGISIESVDGANIKNIHISDVVMKNAATPLFIHLGQRLYAPKGTDIGSIENITIENVSAVGPYVPYKAIPMNYRSFIAKSFIQYPWCSVIPTSLVERVNEEYTDWQITCNVCGLQNRPIKNVTLRNISLTLNGGTKEFERQVSEAPLSPYPEAYVYGRTLPAKGIFFRHIEGLTLDNVNISTYKEDVREPFVFDDVEKLNII